MLLIAKTTDTYQLTGLLTNLRYLPYLLKYGDIFNISSNISQDFQAVQS